MARDRWTFIWWCIWWRYILNGWDEWTFLLVNGGEGVWVKVYFGWVTGIFCLSITFFLAIRFGYKEKNLFKCDSYGNSNKMDISSKSSILNVRLQREYIVFIDIFLEILSKLYQKVVLRKLIRAKLGEKL